MKRTSRRPIVAVTLAGILAVCSIGAARPALATSPWLPGQGELAATPLFTVEVFNEIFMADQRMAFPAGDAAQATMTLLTEYGLRDWLTFDLALGYTMTQATGLPGEKGLNDTYLGVRWRWTDELDSDHGWVPTITLRATGIIKGSYSTGFFPASPGDGASGGEVELIIGKLLPGGFAAIGEGGYRARSGVPNDWLARAELQKVVTEWFVLSAAFDVVWATSGLDLNDPAFDPSLAPQLKERVGNLDVGATFEDKWGHLYQLFYARTLTGRNTGVKNIFGVAVTLPFDVGP